MENQPGNQTLAELCHLSDEDIANVHEVLSVGKAYLSKASIVPLRPLLMLGQLSSLVEQATEVRSQLQSWMETTEYVNGRTRLLMLKRPSPGFVICLRLLDLHLQMDKVIKELADSL